MAASKLRNYLLNHRHPIGMTDINSLQPVPVLAQRTASRHPIQMTIAERLGLALGPTHVIERELAGGGMARLFVASDATLGRRVVVKLLPDDVAAGIGLERFRREIQMLARLQHPNIVPVLTAGDLDGQPFFTMPYVEGESLRAALERSGAFSLDQAVSVLRDVAAALVYAHEQGVVHRDIKPDNVLLSGTAAMVTDFGVAKAFAASGSPLASGVLTSIGVVVGTPAYMAPEQAAGHQDVDHRADIYAFGAMAYELVSGSTPFGDRTPQSLLAAHISERPVGIVRKQSRVPPRLAQLIMQCLNKSPDERPQSAGEVLLRLSASNLLERDYGAVLKRPGVLAVTGAALAASIALVYAGQRPSVEPQPDSATAALSLEDLARSLVGVEGSTSAYIARASGLFDSARYNAARGILELIISPGYLQSVTAAERVEVLTYLGAIHAEQERESEALMHYSAAVGFDPWTTLDPTRFSDRQRAVFDRARSALAKIDIRPADTMPRRRSSEHAFVLVQTQPARVTVTLDDYADPGRSVTLYEGTTVAGQRRVLWDGRFAGVEAGSGAYELRVRASREGGTMTATSVPFVLQHFEERGVPMMRWSRPAPGDLRRSPEVRQAGSAESPKDARPDIALAMRFYDEFNVERAIPLLRAVVQRHDEYPRDQTARAFLYIGVSYALLQKGDSSRMFLRNALRRNPGITLDPGRFSPIEFAALDSARSFGVLAGIFPIEVATPVAGVRFRYFTGYASRRARLSIAVRDVTRSEHHVIFEADGEGSIPVQWNGMIGQAPIPQGRYEVLATVHTDDGQRDSTSAYISVRYETFATGGRPETTLLIAPSP